MASWMAHRRRVRFPPVSWTSPEGVIAVGGVPDPETLVEAYSRGIFPWPHEGLPLLWFCPDPRFALVPAAAHVSRSLRKEMRRGTYGVRADTAFSAVMRGCAEAARPGQDGTWITPGMIAGYTALHAQGLAHSIEAWRGGELVGGLYGVSLGGVFFGESMFSRAPGASKVAFATLLANLAHWRFELVDCQQDTEHLARFGAEDWPRAQFLAALRRSLRSPTRRGPWTLEVAPAAAAEMFGDLGRQDRKEDD
jgi:leucyl/phenylalanyl-tRNA--protein transferase